METKEEMIDRTVKYVLSFEGGEKIINDSLHFGIELYAWKEDVIESNVPYIKGGNECFLHIEPEHVKEYITYLYNRDGCLLIND
jgi:hypothetical protein